ncbi:MAG TPA: hypothetical protein PKA55_08840 [Rhodoblastus sp.]|nr:hypothetical protein [Rhodoblastus sp.]
MLVLARRSASRLAADAKANLFLFKVADVIDQLVDDRPIVAQHRLTLFPTLQIGMCARQIVNLLRLFAGPRMPWRQSHEADYPSSDDADCEGVA